MQIASPGMVMGQPRVKSRGSESSEARIDSKIRERAGKGSVEGPGEPLPSDFWNFELQFNHSGVYCLY